jgi:hypothetical protein
MRAKRPAEDNPRSVTGIAYRELSGAEVAQRWLG